MTRSPFVPTPTPSAATRWVTSPHVNAVIAEWERQELESRKQSEKDGICFQCMNPRLAEHVICAECAEGLAPADMVEYLLPSMKAVYEKEQREEAEEARLESEAILETEASLMPGRV
jgi:hypothetical protein